MFFSSLNVITIITFYNYNIFVKKKKITALVLNKDGITTTTRQNETKDQSTNHNTSGTSKINLLILKKNSNNEQLFCHGSTELQ